MSAARTRPYPLAHGRDFLGVVEHYSPVAQTHPALRDGRYALFWPDAEAEVVAPRRRRTRPDRAASQPVEKVVIELVASTNQARNAPRLAYLVPNPG